jgi:class 3 adenylate cyclase
MTGLSCEEVALRAGVDTGYVRSLVELGILTRADGELTASDVRRTGVIRSLEVAGLSLDAMAAGFARGLLTIDFVDRPEYDKFEQLSHETFAEVAARTGVPFTLLAVVRETTGFGGARPEALVREDELRVVPFIELQLKLGFDPVAIERLLRAMGDNTRRIAEAEAEWWRSQVTGPRLEAGQSGEEVSNPTGANVLPPAAQQALLAIYAAQQAQTWAYNIYDGFRYILAGAGLFEAAEQAPAICFLDITGYTRLTQERGDRAAADLAEQLARLVKRSALEHGGRPVKWLGDGVMCYFGDPVGGALAALEMVDGIVAAGLPPAHVGIHAGPVVIQEGDYYGQTVNMAARIAEYARPGEVLASHSVVDVAEAGAPGSAGLAFSPIGRVELKGVAEAVELYVARRASESAATTHG